MTTIFRQIIWSMLVVLPLTACYHEDKLTPSDVGSGIAKFDFPQGDSEADRIFLRIYNQYGVRVIYKDFTQIDLEHAWLSPDGSGIVSERCNWKYQTSDQLEPAARILDERIFGLLPENLVRSALRSAPYWFLLDDIRYAVNNNLLPLYPTKALDSWSVNLSMAYNQPDNYSMRVFFPVRIMLDIFDYAYANGAVKLPDAFFAGLDYQTYTTSRKKANQAGPGTPDYNNYYARRGFLPFVSPINGMISTGENGIASDMSLLAPLPAQAKELPTFFLFLCLDKHCWEYFEAGNIYADCPKLEQRLRLFNDSMKACGIDFDAIRAKVYEGSTVDTTPTRYKPGTAADDDYSWIYR